MRWQFLVVCITAAVTDILWRRVPNIWLGSWFLTGFLLAGVSPGVVPLEQVSFLGGTGDIGSSWAGYLFRAAAVTGILMPAWKLGMTGAADVKLCGLMAAWMGLSAFALCFLYSLFLGGAAAFVQMVVYRNFSERISYFLAWVRQCFFQGKWISYSAGRQWGRRETIPFSAALLGGCMLWMWL